MEIEEIRSAAIEPPVEELHKWLYRVLWMLILSIKVNCHRGNESAVCCQIRVLAIGRHEQQHERLDAAKANKRYKQRSRIERTNPLRDECNSIFRLLLPVRWEREPDDRKCRDREQRTEQRKTRP